MEIEESDAIDWYNVRRERCKWEEQRTLSAKFLAVRSPEGSHLDWSPRDWQSWLTRLLSDAYNYSVSIFPLNNPHKSYFLRFTQAQKWRKIRNSKLLFLLLPLKTHVFRNVKNEQLQDSFDQYIESFVKYEYIKCNLQHCLRYRTHFACSRRFVNYVSPGTTEYQALQLGHVTEKKFGVPRFYRARGVTRRAIDRRLIVND